MSASLTIRAVEDGADLRRFIRFPWSLYRDRYPDPYWVPPLLSSERALLDKRRCPFFEHGDAHYLLAERDGRPVGRIAAIANDLHVEFHQEPVGFFGFFESIHDREVASALVQAAGDWVRRRGLPVMRGPMNFSTNESCGLLIDGFEEPPTVMMTHNPPWYADLLAAAGMTPTHELLSYRLEADSTRSERIFKIAEKARKRAGIEFRPINMKRFAQDVALVKEVYNDAWERNWGFVPMTDAEIDHMAKDLKPVVDSDLVLLAFINGELVGFSLALPDINQVLHRMNGRLFPLGFLTLMRGLKKITHARIMALGVKKRYQGIGLGSLFYAETIRRAVGKGYRSGEASWILADNIDMRRPLEEMGGRINKRYMVYEQSLSPQMPGAAEAPAAKAVEPTA